MSESKELTVPQRAAVALESARHEQELIALAKKYSDITEIRNPAGREQTHGAMMELANRRIAITKAGKEARDDATKFSKAVIEEEKRLVALIEPEEGRLRTLRDEWDAEREREKAAKAAAEKARVDAIRQRITDMQAIPSLLVGKSAETIAAAIDSLEVVQITLESHQEFAGEAEIVKAVVIAKLGEMLACQQAHEVEQTRIAAERAQLERERAEAAERERIAAAARAEEERKAREARQAEEARLRAEREAHEAELRRQREVEEAKLAEQRAEIARQQAAIDAERQRQADEAARVEREKQAAIAAEAARVAEEERRKREAEEAAARAEAERIRAEQDAAIAEQQRRERVEFEKHGPGDDQILVTVATQFDVDADVALGWLAKFNVAALINKLEKAA
ncbi:hypothetical protein [Paraburkholderia antibiotica]|uniref:Uncharacterized protein n=1 Tax=Paraburkholderia antibiotica TaxID=2728839 RepID=A0A7Y0FGD0_9BURK|nr:hypothetical protein [Paraburkholderia antibiotica]NML34895.1 hypothetical protein [Paraburkholderia antibiotica]